MKIIPLKIESEAEAKRIMAQLGVSNEGANIMASKAVTAVFKIEGIKSWEANIIKQHLLSLGSDSAINRAALIKDITTDTIIFGSICQLKKLCEKLKTQPFGLSEISQTLSSYINNLSKRTYLFEARNKFLRIEKPVICGIINLTPDSFSGDGLLKMKMAKSKLQALVLAKASQMVKAGAKMLDIGAESSRPFSLPVSEKEEIKRLSLALSSLRKEFKNIIISIDTYKFKTAKFAAQEGIDVINDISGLRKNPQIVSLIKKYHLGFVLMHMKSSPRTMQLNPKYRNVTEEIIDFFKERLNFLGKNGITASQILIDPGIGFGKRASDNLKIIEELYKLKILGLPIFIGVSRKSFIGKVLNREPDERLSGTVCANIVSCFNGANILRVHDVKENFAAVKIFSAITNN